MVDKGYLFAKDEKRLFINPSLGCTSHCKFCYLPQLGINKIASKSWEDIYKLLRASKYKVTKNTLITLGCYSECFDEKNKKETLKIIKYFLKKGNQIQVSTKKYVSYDDIKELIPLIKYYGQLVILVSSSTITSYDDFELGTDLLKIRFKTFELIKYNIPIILYIKPVISNITIKDIKKYKKIIKDNNISNVVVGSLFTEKISTEQVHFSNKSLLYYTECEDEKSIIEQLKPITKVWRRSTEVMEELNKKAKVDEVKKEVEILLKMENSGHGMDHINRVYNMSSRFAMLENADIFITSLIALLHDVDDYKLFGEASSKDLTNAKMIMKKANINEEDQEKVLDSIKKIGYKKSLMGIRPTTLEGKIVSDADMCDGLGVNGILRTYDYQKAHGRPFFDRKTFPNTNINAQNYKICDDSAVCHCFEKLLHLKNMMMTKSGKKEAMKRHDIIVSILYNLFEEENAFEWIKYLDDFLKEIESKKE